MFDGFFKHRKRYFSKKPALELQKAVEDIRKELDEHLDAINMNGSEIQESYGCMNEISNKMDKLAERLERIEVFLQTNSSFIIEEKSFSVQPLTRSEQEIFMVVYALEDEKGMVSCADVARKLGIAPYMVGDYLVRLVEKGVPLIKKYVNNAPYIKLNPEFKRLQALENILQIDAAQKQLLNFN